MIWEIKKIRKKPINKLQYLYRNNKDKIHKNDKTSIVYKIKCPDCNNKNKNNKYKKSDKQQNLKKKQNKKHISNYNLKIIKLQAYLHIVKNINTNLVLIRKIITTENNI